MSQTSDSGPPGRPPFTASQTAAEGFLIELLTRIATQRLPYQRGNEVRALERMVELFDLAREAVRANPGCGEFASLVVPCLNTELRPLTAKWDRAAEQDSLRSRDGGDAFRSDLAAVQVPLRVLAGALHQMVYGSELDDQQADGPMDGELEALFHPLPFGIPPDRKQNGGIGSEVAKQIADDERDAVKGRRGCPAEADAVGLALSGGGIRSATFSLGVVQVLAERGMLGQVDFLSTVSGGGYTGSFITSEIGSPDRDSGWETLAYPDGPDTEPVRRLRHRAKYLTARSLWEAWSMVTATVAGTLLNWTVPLLLLTAVAALTLPLWKRRLDHIGWIGLNGIGVLIVTVAALMYFMLLRKGSRAAMMGGRAFGVTVLVSLAMLGSWGLYWAFLAIFGEFDGLSNLSSLWERFSRSPLFTSWPGIAGLSVGTLSTLLPAITRFLPFLEKPAVRKLTLKLAMVVAGAFLPAVAVVTYLWFVAFGNIEKVFFGMSGEAVLWILTGLLLAVAVFVLNINLTAPHRLYRNALSKTFVELSANGSPDIPLPQINPRNQAPYHLINAAVNIPSTTEPGIRERTCDFFLFSREWVGSPLVGYHRAKDWRMNGKPADLATAMAISGAAFSTHMGLGSVRPLRALLAFLNVRLGFWIRNPRRKGMWGRRPWKHPGFVCLLREMSGVGMAEHHRWLNLSDGGHIENMGAYELIRRRCKFIVCVDGESDGGFTFQGLMTLVRHAQIDFGVRIDASLNDLRPDAATGFSRSHYHLCRIHYPDAGPGSPQGTGLLLYLKLSVTGNESELIRRYRTNNPEFPHQSTLDQFFDQEQFEAYRQLGVHAANGLFAPCLMDEKSVPDDIAEWFRRLAGNLLEPTR